MSDYDTPDVALDPPREGPERLEHCTDLAGMVEVIGEWHAETFGPAVPAKRLARKLLEESAEFMVSRSEDEAADVLIVLFAWAYRQGVDLAVAIREKFGIVVARYQAARDDEPPIGGATCRSCGKPLVGHPGLFGTCAAYHAAKAREREMVDALTYIAAMPDTAAAGCATEGLRRAKAAGRAA